jgi:hypothetical protein
MGFSSAVSQETTDTILELNRQSIEWIRNSEKNNIRQNPSSTAKNSIKEDSSLILSLVDWGAAIWPRSLRPNRIQGDIAAHYGLEARLLMAQMTTQQLQRILLSGET